MCVVRNKQECWQICYLARQFKLAAKLKFISLSISFNKYRFISCHKFKLYV